MLVETGDEVTEDETLQTGDDVTSDDQGEEQVHTGDEVTPDASDTGDEVTDDDDEAGTVSETGDDVTPAGSEDDSDSIDLEEEEIAAAKRALLVQRLKTKSWLARASAEEVGRLLAAGERSVWLFWSKFFVGGGDEVRVDGVGAVAAAASGGRVLAEVTMKMMARALEEHFPAYFVRRQVQHVLHARVAYGVDVLMSMVAFAMEDPATPAPGGAGVISADMLDRFVRRFGPFKSAVATCLQTMFVHADARASAAEDDAHVVVELHPAPWLWLNNSQLSDAMATHLQDGMFVLTLSEGVDDPHLLLRVCHAQMWVNLKFVNRDGRLQLDSPQTVDEPTAAVFRFLFDGRERPPASDMSLRELIDDLVGRKLIQPMVSPLYTRAVRCSEQISLHPTQRRGVHSMERRADVLAEVQRLRASIRAYYTKPWKRAGREVVFWNKVCDRVASVLKTYERELDARAAQLDYQMYDLRCHLESAGRLWRRATRGKVKLMRKDEQFSVKRLTPSFEKMEDAVYLSLVDLLKSVEARTVAWEHDERATRKPWHEHKRNMRVRRLFFFRMFELEPNAELTWAQLSRALALYLRVEFGQVKVSAHVLQQMLVLLTQVQSANVLVERRRWLVFMDRFGPLPFCYGKASAVCEVDDPLAYEPQVRLAHWFRFWDRPRTELFLNEHARIARRHKAYPDREPLRPFRGEPHTLFYFRHGRGEEHVFSLSFIVRNLNEPQGTDGDLNRPARHVRQTHTKVIACPLPPPEGSQLYALPNRGFHFDENPNKYDSVFGLLEMVVKRLKWSELAKPLEDAKSRWGSMNLLWSHIHSETNQPVHHLFDLDSFFSGYVAQLVEQDHVRARDFELPEETPGKAIRRMLYQNELQHFVQYCQNEHVEAATRRKALESYGNGILVHELVHLAVSDAVWVEALEAVLEVFIADHDELEHLDRADVVGDESISILRSGYNLFHKVHPITHLTPVETIVEKSVTQVRDAVPEWLTEVAAAQMENAKPTHNSVKLLLFFEQHQLLHPSDLFHVLSLAIEKVHVGLFRAGLRAASQHELDVASVVNPPLATDEDDDGAAYLPHVHSTTSGNNLFHVISALDIPGCAVVEDYQLYFCRNLHIFLRSSFARVTQVHPFAWSGDAERVHVHLDLVDARNVAGQTPALIASERRHRRLLQFYLHECQASYDVLDENNNALFNYILADLDNWLSDDPHKNLLSLFQPTQYLATTVNHRNRRNQSPLFIVLAKLKHLEDLDKSDSAVGELKQMLSLKDDILVLESLMYKLLTSGALLDSLSGHQAKSDELRTYFLSKLVTAMADDREDRDRWVIFESAVRNRDTELVKGILSSKELPYFFMPPGELTGEFRRDAEDLAEFAIALEMRGTDSAQYRRLSLKPGIDYNAARQRDSDDEEDDTDAELDHDDAGLVSESEVDGEEDEHKHDEGVVTRISLPSSALKRMQTTSSMGQAEEEDEGEAISPLKSMLHVAVGLRDQDPELVDLLLSHNPSSRRLKDTARKTVEEGKKAGQGRRRHRRRCLRPNPNAIDRRGRTALHVVAQLAEPSSRSLVIASSLIAHVDVLAKDWRGYTALHYAAENGNLELVRLLLASHAEPSEETTRGQLESSFLRCQHALSTKTRKWVVESNDAVIKARTALHLAAKYGHWQVASELLRDVKVGEDVDEVNSLVDPIDETGRTPLCLALERRRRMEKFLADFNAHAPMRQSGGEVEMDGLDGEDDGEDLEGTAMIFFNSTRGAPGVSDPRSPVGDGHVIEMPPSRNSATQGLLRADNLASPVADSSMLSRVAHSRARVSTYRPTYSSTDSKGQSSDKDEVRLRKRANKRNIQIQLIMQLLQEAGAEVLEKYTEEWSLDHNVVLDINYYEEIAYTEDVAKLKRRFDNTVKKLLASGASIETATSSAGYELDELIDVAQEWIAIRDEVQRYEGKKLDQLAHRGQLAPMFEQKKRDVFDERQNQIVIDWRYSTSVWNKLALRLLAYIIFIMVATALSVHETTKDELSAHYFYESLSQTLIGDEYPHNVSQLLRSYEGIDDKSEFYMWMQGPFLDVFYPEEDAYWDGPNQTRRDLGFINKQARLIGVPRLRQLRSRTINCDVPDAWRDVDRVCFASVADPDSETYGPDIPGLEPWEYSSEDKLRGAQTFGRVGVYPGGGHVVLFPSPVEENSRAKALRLVRQLEEYSFIDSRTRALFVEFSAFSANQNFFAPCQLILEFPRSGGTVVSSSIEVSPIRRYVDSHDRTVNATLEVVLVLLLVFFVLNHSVGGMVRYCSSQLVADMDDDEHELRPSSTDTLTGHSYKLTADRFPPAENTPRYAPGDLMRPGARAKKHAGGSCHSVGRCCSQTGGRLLSRLYISVTEDGALVNWCLRLSLAVLVFFRLLNLAEAEDIDWTEQNAYVPVIRLSRYTFVETQAWSMFIFFAWFKLLTLLKAFRALSKLIIMIDFMLADLLDFTVLLVLVLVAFASAEYIAYGYADPTSPTWFDSFITRLSFAFSGREIDSRNEVNRVLGVLYPMIFVIIVSLLLLNLLIAILTSAYDRARTRAGKSYWARWQYEKIRSEYDSPPVFSGASVPQLADGCWSGVGGWCRRSLAAMHPRVSMEGESADLESKLKKD